MSTLIQAVKSVIQLSMVGGLSQTTPAYSVPVVLLADSTAFDRGAIAAMSLKAQKNNLKAARIALKLGLLDIAKERLALWKKERNAYNVLISLNI